MNKYLEKIAYKTRAAHNIGKMYANKGNDEKAYNLAMNIKGKYEKVQKAKHKYNEFTDAAKYYELTDSDKKKKKKDSK
jgi:hypothetical protein